MLRQTSNVFVNIRQLAPVDMCHIMKTQTCYQHVRWARKPICLPTAKSKLFRVPVKPETPEEDRIELSRLTNNYNTLMKSIRYYLMEQHEEKGEKNEIAETLLRKQDESHAECVRINDEWNTQVAKLRQERIAHREEKIRELAMQRLIEHEEEERQKIKMADEIVKSEKAMSETYITADNIDEAIERALSSEVDYNFAIDLEGNKYHGRNTKPSDVRPEEQVVARAAS